MYVYVCVFDYLAFHTVTTLTLATHIYFMWSKITISHFIFVLLPKTLLKRELLFFLTDLPVFGLSLCVPLNYGCYS